MLTRHFRLLSPLLTAAPRITSATHPCSSTPLLRFHRSVTTKKTVAAVTPLSAPTAASSPLAAAAVGASPASAAAAGNTVRAGPPCKILCLLYPGGESGRRNPDILGCEENGLGLPGFLSSSPALSDSCSLVVTSSYAVFDRELPTAAIVISQPFYPAYLTRRRLESARCLQLCITAGVGSDHVDLQAAMERRLTVAEVTGSNVVSVAEHVLLTVLALLRNYNEGHRQAEAGEWDVARVADRAWDLQGKDVGTLGAGRIGIRVLQRLQPFDVRLHYHDKIRQPPEVEAALSLRYHPTLASLLSAVDVLTINCPLHPETEGLVGSAAIACMKRGSFIVNTARAKIVDRDAVVHALQSGRLLGYGGDVWWPEPAPPSHPWRQLGTKGAMTVHYSGSTLDAQRRYAAGVQEMIACWLRGEPLRETFLIVDKGVLVSRSYTEGDSTAGVEEEEAAEAAKAAKAAAEAEQRKMGD